MGEARTIAEIVLGRPETLTTLVVVAAVLVPTAVLVARRGAWSPGRTVTAALAALGTALVVATTLGRYDTWSHAGWQVHCLLQPGLSARSPEEQLNLLLLTPACFFGVLALRRFLPVLAGAVLLSSAIELVQSLTGMGTCQTADVVRNVAGGAAAGLVALVLVRGSGLARFPVSRRRSG